MNKKLKDLVIVFAEIQDKNMSLVNEDLLDEWLEVLYTYTEPEWSQNFWHNRGVIGIGNKTIIDIEQ